MKNLYASLSSHEDSKTVDTKELNGPLNNEIKTNHKINSNNKKLN